MKTKTIKVEKYYGHKMAFVSIGKECVFTGNFWDFHSSCHGPKIGGYDLTGKWYQGIYSLAQSLKKELEKDGFKVNIKEVELTHKQYAKIFPKGA